MVNIPLATKPFHLLTQSLLPLLTYLIWFFILTVESFSKFGLLGRNFVGKWFVAVQDDSLLFYICSLGRKFKGKNIQ